MTQKDKLPPEGVREFLDDTVESIDSATKAELQSIRYTALQQRPSSISSEKREWFFLSREKLVSATVMASALALVIGLWQQQRTDFHESRIDLEISAEFSPTELELVEDLEFYEWLDSHGYAG